jgi:serine/threonine protein kinase
MPHPNDPNETNTLLPKSPDDVRETADLPAAPQDPTPGNVISAEHVPVIPGYELHDEIGRGGMGVVYRARDRNMDREVAVKLLQDKFAPESSSAIRFVEEAKITGQLQHPGIPAVYHVGKLSDGRPYLAMKLIKGDTLEDLLKFQTPINVLGVFEAICQAVGYAHAHQVIHRDLKPANIMVGSFGEVQVMDWGLAKVIDSHRSGEVAEGAPGETTAPTEIRSKRESDGSFTQAGSVMGTPAYMPQEQAAGENDKIDRSSDVFGLGAILCTLLTGKPPFDGNTAENVRLNAVRGKTEAAFLRLDSCCAEPDLVALCKRCLAFEQSGRPRDADALAVEVAMLRIASEERALQAQMQKAKAEVTAAEQAKRRRLVAWSSLAVASVLLVGLAGTLVGLRNANRARADAEQAELAERAAKNRSDEAVEQAKKVLDAMTSDETEDKLTRQQELTDQQKAFLKTALAFYEKLAEGRADDEKSRERLGDAAHRVGAIQSRFGQKEEALASYRKSLAIREKLMAEFPESAIHRERISDSHNSIALIQDDLKLKKEALVSLLKALSIREKLMNEFPASPIYRERTADSLNSIGIIQVDLDQNTEALISCRKALGIREKLIEDFPTSLHYRARTSDSHNNIGIVQSNQGQKNEALESYRKALAIRENLMADYPASPLYRERTADSHHNIGLILSDQGQKTEALESHRKALALRERLATEFTALSDYRADTASSHHNIGLLTSDPSQKLEFYRKALAIREKLLADFPTRPDYRQNTAASYYNIGSIQDDQGQQAEALESYRKALAIREKLMIEFPASPIYRERTADIHNNIGVIQSDQGQKTQAFESYRNALALREKLMAEVPESPTYRKDVAASHNNIGSIQDDQGQKAEALASYRKALTIREKLMTDFPSVATYRADTAAIYRNLAFALSDPIEKRNSHLQALAIREKLLADFPDNASYRTDVGKSLFNIACSYATMKTLPEDMNLNQALEYLTRAVKAGNRNLESFETDSDLDPLRARDDFKKLLAEVIAKERGSKPEAGPKPREVKP